MASGERLHRTDGARRWRVYCSQWASCGWAGYRKGVTREDVTKKPCRHCGREVAC